MENLIGAEIDKVPTLAKTPDTALHLYGKTETRPGRKMGHINKVIRRNT
jgi:5-(carboxyamino)imidazole ribonucleotide synthase